MKKALYLITILLLVLAGCQTATLPAPVSPTLLLPTLAPSPTIAPPPTSGQGYAKLDDITMYFEWRGEGKPLILLHGQNASTKSWFNQIFAFSKQYRVIALDSRAQGQTTDSGAPISYHLMAEDTIRLMDYLKLDSAYVVGWSDGGIIGIDMAIHHPERIKALVAYGANTTPEGINEKTLTEIKDGTFYGLGPISESYLTPQPEPQPLLERLRFMTLTQPNFTADELAGIKVPTLIIDGEEDEFIRIDHVKAIAKAIPGAKLILLPDVGHFAPEQKPGEWNTAVLDFLKDK